MSDYPRHARIEQELIELMPVLRQFARRFHHSPSDIDDLVQETVVKALSNADKFQEGTRLKSWLFTIMRNSFCTRFALSKREHVGLEDDTAMSPAVPAAQEWAVRGHELEDALMDLPDHYRSAIELIFIRGVSYETAAEECCVPVGTVKSRVNRARQHLSQRLGSDGT